MTASAFGHDDPLMPELLSWISCAAVLGGLAGSVAVTTCCQAIRQAAGCASAPSLQQCGSGSEAESSLDEQLAMYEDETQPGQALDQASCMASWRLLFRHPEASKTYRETSAPMLHNLPTACHAVVLAVCAATRFAAAPMCVYHILHQRRVMG